MRRTELDVFRQWEAPGNFKIELFVIRVGDWGGYMLADCDDPLTVHKFISRMLPCSNSQTGDSGREQPCALTGGSNGWRDGLKFSGAQVGPTLDYSGRGCSAASG